MTIQAEFVRTLYPIIEKEAKARGYNFPVSILAQAAKESNWGKSLLSSKYFNFFGMKCGSKWGGASVSIKTKEEYTQGVLTTITDNFRVYDSIESGIIGYFDFINTARYSNLRNATSEVNFFELLRDDGYFTSSSYVQSIGAFLKQCHDILNDKEEETEPVKYEGLVGVLNDLVEYIVTETINKKYGNGDDRKRALGEYYSIIQERVNRRLR